MNARHSKVLRCAALWLLGAGFTLAQAQAQAQTTTVAGSTPGQFSVNESGAATYRIPIQVPPGVAGMEPKLELSYNSQGGNGLLGMGWGLSGLSVIGRCARIMAVDGAMGSVNFDMNDRYCLDGQRLILVSGTYGVAGSEYRTELDSFSKIVASGTAGSGVASFTVQTKAGLTMEYGNTADSRIEAQGKATVRVWAVNKISDVKTNYMTFSYTEDNANGDYYPSRIDYAGNSAAGRQPTNSVQFSYEARPDITPMYHMGSLVKNSVRLNLVQIYSDSVARKKYQLAYVQAAAVLPSRILNIQECDPAGLQCLAPIALGYASTASPASVSYTASNYNILKTSSYGANWSMVPADVRGIGKADMVAYYIGANEGVIIQPFLTNGDGTYTASTYNVLRTSSFGANWYMTPADVNGDGKMDMVAYYIGANEGVIIQPFLSNGDGTYTAGTYNVLRTSSFGTYWKMVPADVNGDGKMDMVAYYIGANEGVIIQPFLSNGDGTYTAGPYNVLKTSSYGANWYMAPADVNGDGKMDMVAYFIGTPEQWGVIVQPFLSNGDGTYTAGPYNVLKTSSYGTNWYMTLADVNGDGKMDMVAYYVGAPGQLGVYIQAFLSNGDGTYTTGAYNTMSTSSFGAYWKMAPADVNGDGKTDMVAYYIGADQGVILQPFYSNGDGVYTAGVYDVLRTSSFGANWYMTPADSTGSGKADMVAYYIGTPGQLGVYVQPFLSQQKDTFAQSISASGSSSLAVSYKPLTDSAVYTKDTAPNAVVYPKIDLQYPQYVVSTVASSNGLGGTTTTQYSYGGLKAEQGTGRGMLGFRWMKSKNLSNNIESYTEFNQSWPFTGSVLKSETRLAGSGNAGVLKRTTNSYAQGTGSATGTTFVYPS
ncbi:virulence plasmid B protein, partial [Polaromonas sp. CF318]|uniref:SpvB/TcaC N-terminal domain-containing protein n=1 Tax=Polaromonas sp. CF318 TaxID=1144318 RepID=UPI00027135D9